MGEYEYNFDENITEKEIEVGTIEPGKSVTKFYEVKTNKLSETETEKEITTKIDTYINETKANEFTINNYIKSSDAEVFVEAKLDNQKNRWNYYITISECEAEKVTLKLKVPKDFEFLCAGEILEHGNAMGEFIPEEEITIDENNVISIEVKPGEYTIQGFIDTREEGEDNKIELKAVATVIVDGVEYVSNENRIEYSFSDFSVELSSENEGEEVRYEDEIIYNLYVTNTGKTNSPNEGYDTVTIKLTDYLPEEVNPVSLTYEYFEIDEHAI